MQDVVDLYLLQNKQDPVWLNISGHNKSDCPDACTAFLRAALSIQM
jgi:hypothetical protein